VVIGSAKWILEAGVQREDPERSRAEGDDPRSLAGQDAAERRRGRWQRRRDEEVEDELVGGAEQVDDELLRARRLEGNDEVADGEDRAGRAGQDAGEELGDAERERAGGDSGESRPPDRDRGLCRRLGGHALNTTRVAICIVRRGRHRSCCSGGVAGMVWGQRSRARGARALCGADARRRRC
jgi:hypothetical protein